MAAFGPKMLRPLVGSRRRLRCGRTYALTQMTLPSMRRSGCCGATYEPLDMTETSWRRDLVNSSRPRGLRRRQGKYEN